MSKDKYKELVQGCYVTIPTMVSDPDLELNIPAIKDHVRFQLRGGMKTGNALLLAGGAAGGFSTMTFDERIEVASAVVEEANGRIPIIMGAQTTSTRELIQLSKSAEKIGAQFIQVSPPFYFNHTEEDFYEYVAAAAEASDIGIILYNTHWTSANISMELVDKLIEIPNMAGLKWSVPNRSNFILERIIENFKDRINVIDNANVYISTHQSGARAIEIHQANYWPEWAHDFWNLLENSEYEEAQRQINKVIRPFYILREEMERYTSGDGYLDKLCLECIGFSSSRERPPTRDVREKFRDKTRLMLIESGVPNVIQK